MSDQKKTKAQLIEELGELRRRVSELEQQGTGQAEDILPANDERYRIVADYTDDWEYWCAPDGKIVYTSPSCERITGYRAQEFMENPSLLEEIVHPDDHFLFRQHKSLVLQDESEHRVHETDFRILRKNGEVRWIGHTCQIIRRAGGTSLGWRATNRDITESKQAETALRDSERQYRRLFEAAKDGILILDANTGQIVDVNPFLVELLGYSFEEFQGKKLWEVGLFKNIATSKAAFVKLRKKGYSRYEDMPFETKGGKQITVEFVSNVYQVDHAPVVQCNIRDITERKHAEKRIHKLSRIYAVLSDVNKTIVRVREMQTLVEQICRIAVEKGGFRMAWIGLLAPQTGEIRSVAHAGVTDGYLEKLHIVPDDSRRGYGPTAGALQTREHIVANDIEHDPSMVPWREDALLLGYRVSAAFPLIVSGEVCGALNLYAPEPDFFDDEELKLLDEMAMNISFAMEYAEQDAQRKRVEREIESLARFAAENPNPILRVDQDGCISYTNTAGEILLQHWDCAVGSHLPPAWHDVVDKAVETQCHPTLDVECGDRICSIMIAPIPQAGYINFYGQDITERKRMEQAIYLMSDTQRQIAHLDDVTDIYRLVGQKVLELIESGYVAVTMLDEQAQAMKMVGFYGLGSLYEKLVRTFKVDPSTITYPLKDMSDDELHLFRSGRLEKFEGGLYNILVRKVPKHICDDVERKLNLTSIYTMSIAWQDTYFGGLTVMPKRDISPYKDMIETITNQAAIAIKRVRSEEALRKSEESLRKAQQVAHVGSWVWHIQTNRLEWSDEMYRIFGIEKESFTGALTDAIARAIHPDDRAAVEQSNLSVARDKKPMPLEYRAIRPDGTVRTVWAEAGELILDEVGNPTILTGIVQDITERKQTEEALHQSEALFHSLVESLPQNVFTKDMGGYFTFANQRYCDTEGKSTEDILGKTDFDLHPPELASKYRDDDRRVIETGQVLDMVEEHQPFGKDKFYVQVIKAPLYDGKGNVAGILGAFWDITARRRAEETLHLQSAALESAANAIAITDSEGIIQWTNSAFTTLTGYTAGESHGHNPRELLRSGLHDVPFYKKLWDTILARQVWRGEMINRRKDGTLYTEEQTITPVLDAQGHVTNFVSVKQDITERKQAEETLHILSSRQEAILAAIPDILMEVDTNKVYTWANPAGLEFFGEDIVGKDAAFYFEGEQDIYDQVDALFNGSENLIYVESWQRRKDGEKRLLAWLCQALKHTDGNQIGALSSAHDITDRKRAEDALRQRASQLLLLNDIGRRVASVMDLDELLDTTASLIHESFGYEHVGIFIIDKQQEDDLIMKARAGLYASRFHADHRLKLGQGMIGWVALYGKKLLANDVSTEMRFHDPFGDGLIKAELSVPIRAELGNVGVIDIQSRQLDAFSENDVMVMETLADVLATAIHNARLYQELESYSSILEQAVRDRTEELNRTKVHIEAILNSVGEAIIVFGTDYRIHQVNPAFERLTGYSAAEVELHRYDDPHVVMELSDDIFRQVSETHGGHDWHGEMQVHRRDDTLFDADVSISPVLDTQNKVVAFVGAMRDITLLKEVERLKDAFVSNVSHELRTPITSLKLLHHLLGVNPSKQSSYLEQMGRVINRLNVLIEDLLRLSRLEQGQVEMNTAPVNLNALATQYVTDLTLLAESKQLALVVESSPNQVTVQANGGLLGQVLSVLLTNALSYTPAGGSVVVSTLTSEQEGQLWAGFSVSDTGTGISAEEQQLLFQRFFRGRVGQASGAPGSGLGLAIAREIVMRHGGRLTVESKGIPGEGAVFTVWLPVKSKTPDELKEE